MENDIRLVVDRLPNDWTECYFAEKRPHDIFYAQCKLTGVSCGLDSCGYCERLVSVWDIVERRW